MQATGTLFMSKTPPLATVAKDGTFTLTLLTYDRMGAHKVEGWRISHFGPKAQAFWAEHQAALKPGTPLTVTTEQICSLNNGRFGAAEITAQVIEIRLQGACALRKQLSETEQKAPQAQPA